MIRGDEHILIIKLSSIGDVVHTIPVVEVLKENYPELRIDWCIDKEASSLIEGYTKINRIIALNRKDWKSKIKDVSKWAEIVKDAILFSKELRREKYDIVIDLQGLLKSGIIAAICRAERKIGLNGSRECSWIFLKEKVPVRYDQHAIDRYLEVAKYLGCPYFKWNWPTYIGEEEKKKVDGIISQINKDNHPIIAINPYARWETKLWSIEKFSDLCKRLKEKGFRPILLGSRDERGFIDKIEHGINLSGFFTLKELIYLYSKVDAVISLDTGTMHIAVMSGAKVISLFGPTEPNRTGPYGKNSHVIKAGVSCSPCFKKRCEKKECMDKIEVDMVINKLEEIL